EAVADELVVARALQGGDVLEARLDEVLAGQAVEAAHTAIGGTAIKLAFRRLAVDRLFVGTDRSREGQSKGNDCCECTLHDAETLTEPSSMTMPVKTTPVSTLRRRIRSPAEPDSSVTPETVISSGPWR